MATSLDGGGMPDIDHVCLIDRYPSSYVFISIQGQIFQNGLVDFGCTNYVSSFGRNFLFHTF